MAELKIITQNLGGYKDYEIAGSKQETDLNILKAVKGKYKNAGKEVDDVAIYAFQELGKGINRALTYTIVADEQLQKSVRVSAHARKIWDDAFPWSEFRSGFWDERDIVFAGKQIKIINFHSSPTYNLAIRFILWKRIPKISSGYTILLGDFNAAFEEQTEAGGQDIIESANFLERTKKYGFKECMIDGETEKNPHYTHSYIIKANDPKNNKLVRNKLDHIFISESLFELIKGSYTIEYFDEVNYLPNKLDENGEIEGFFSNHNDMAFTDHSGIKLTIELPDA